MSVLSDLNLNSNDYQWFAVDLNGTLATFVTGGHAPIASYFISHSDVMEAMELRLAGIPVSGDNRVDMCAGARSHIRYPEWRDLPSFGDLGQWALRGFYVYDVSYVDEKCETYYRLYRCTRPLSIHDIDCDLAKVLQEHVCMQCEFSQSELIPRQLIP